MEIPTAEEIRAAYDGITEDGTADNPLSPTMALVALVMIDPLMVDTMDRHVAVLDTFIGSGVFGEDGGYQSKLVFVTSCIVKGLNLGLRIGAARAERYKAEGRMEMGS